MKEEGFFDSEPVDCFRRMDRIGRTSVEPSGRPRKTSLTHVPQRSLSGAVQTPGGVQALIRWGFNLA